MAAPRTFCEATEEITTDAIYDGNTWECCGNENAYERARAERFKIYEQFGLIYDADKDELYYNGKTVRWFEDYYPVGTDSQSQAGIDFFNDPAAGVSFTNFFTGTVDIEDSQLPQSFEKCIIYRKKCESCHIAGKMLVKIV